MHTKRSSSDISHGSQSGYFWGWCSGFFVSGATKSEGTHQTKHHSQLWVCHSTVHIPRMYYSTESSSKENKSFISGVWSYMVWEKSRLGQSRGCLWFLEKVRFSECVPSPASEPAMLIVGISGWAFHRASKSAVKQCLSRLSPKLPNATSLKPWYLRYAWEDFISADFFPENFFCLLQFLLSFLDFLCRRLV